MAITELNDENFEQALQEHPKVIVKYFADWCGSCKLFAPKFKRLSNDERFQAIYFAEVNAEKNPDSRRKAGVDHLPFFAIFQKGSLVKGLSTSKEEKVVELLNELIET
jgi:thioredoxin-like negative regulator of GroEL